MTWPEIALVVLILGSFLVLAVVLPSKMRALRAMEPVTGWVDMDPDRKRAITRALRRGEAVEDPREAAIAIESAEQNDRVLALFRPVNWLYSSLFLGLLLIGLFAPGWRPLTLAGAGGLALGGLLDWFIAQQRRRVNAGVAATRARHDHLS